MSFNLRTGKFITKLINIKEIELHNYNYRFTFQLIFLHHYKYQFFHFSL